MNVLKKLSMTVMVVAAMSMHAQTPRARALGVPFDGTPGPLNAITMSPALKSDT